MGVFQRKAEQSPQSPQGGNFQRRRSVDKKRRFTHPTGEHNSFESLETKWSPTVPPPEVVEADINGEKGEILADDFSSWTGPPDDQEIKVPLDESSRTDRSLGPVPIPKPRARTSKDPYAKRKAFFNQKPKLAPITEADSGGETDSARSSRTSAVYENVVIDMDNSMKTPIIEEEHVGNGLDEMEEREMGAQDEEENEKDTGKRTNNKAYYQNVMIGEDGSMVIALSNGVMPQNNLNKENEEEGLYDFVGDINLAAGYASGTAEKLDTDKELNDKSDISEKDDIDKEINRDDMNQSVSDNDENGAEGVDNDRRDAEADKSLKRDTGVGDGIISMEDLRVDLQRDSSVITIPDDTPVLAQTGSPRPNSDGATKPSTHTMDIQTDDDDQSNSFTHNPKDIINEELRKQNHEVPVMDPKKSYDISEVETKDTGVGTSTDDLDVHQSYEDLQLEIEEATGMLDEVVFGKGRSTQTGDSLRWGGERSNQIVQVMNRANASNRPISECIVVDSTTNTLETVAVGSTENLAVSKSDLISTFSETNISSIVSPSMMAEVPERPKKSKKMIGLLIFFFILILGIIAAGIAIYFVFVHNQPATSDPHTYYYLGMELANVEYDNGLQDKDNNKYISISVDSCTFIKAVYDNSPLSSSYRDCSLEEFRQGDYNRAIAHLKLQFDRVELAKIDELNSAMSTSETISWYLKYHLENPSNSMVSNFKSQYGPVISKLRIVRYSHELANFGSVPPTR